MEELIRNLKRVRVDMEKIYDEFEEWEPGYGFFTYIYADVKDLIHLELDGEYEIDYIHSDDVKNDPNLVLLLEFEYKNKPFDQVYKWTAEGIFFYTNEKLEENDELYNYFLEKTQLKTV